MRRNPLLYATSIAVLIVAGAVCLVATETASTLRHVAAAADSLAAAPVLLAARVTAVQNTVSSLPAEILPPVLKRVDAGIGKMDAQITALRGELMARVDKIESLADTRSGETLAIAAGIQADLRPVLTNAAAITKDAQDSLDDLYPDIKGSTESATVAITSIAQASEAMRDAAPKVAQSVVGISASVNGIAADVHAATTDFVKPKTTWQKVRMWLETAGKVAARFI